jgi:hypothetical protein
MNILAKISSYLSSQWEAAAQYRRKHYQQDVSSHGSSLKTVLAMVTAFILILLGSIVVENYSFPDYFSKHSDKIRPLEVVDRASNFVSLKIESSQNPISALKEDVDEALYIPLAPPSKVYVGLDGKALGVCDSLLPCIFVINRSDSSRILTLTSISPDSHVTLKTDFPSFVADQADVRAFTSFLEKVKSEQNRRVSMLARILLALFCAMIYFTIERSPETLGLSLLSGFEASALLFGFNGITPPILPTGISYAFEKHFFWALADFFRVYFTFQICRVGRPSTKHWFLWGVPISLVYGFCRYGEVKWGWAWANQSWAYKDFFFGNISGAVSFFVMLKLIDVKLWRRAAIVGLVFIANIPEIGVAAGELFLKEYDLGYYSAFFTFLESNSVIILMLCTLLNVSDLETKVRTLVDLRKIDYKLEQELQLAEAVQKSLLQSDFENDFISFKSLYKPASYVSGDMYFVNWDNNDSKATILLYDVVGHGVQAALKASAAFAIADTIWNSKKKDVPNINKNKRKEPTPRLSDSKILVFEDMVHRHLLERGSGEDFCALVAVEIDFKNKKLCVYRSNYGAPILIQAKGGSVNISKLNIPNRELCWFDFDANTKILIASDGLINNSRTEKKIVDDLSKNLTKENCHESILKYLTLEPSTGSGHGGDDVTVLEVTVKSIEQKNKNAS